MAAHEEVSRKEQDCSRPRTAKDGKETLASARHRLAANVGFAARKLWRRNDLDSKDQIILDLLLIEVHVKTLK